MGDKTEQFRPKRVFVNDVDGYSSGYIAKFLSTCKPGELSEELDVTVTNREHAFHIVGTVSSSTKSGKTNFLKQIYDSPSREELLQCLLECDVVLYNISENATPQLRIEEATWAMTALHDEMENFTTQKTFILVSTLMTWAMTKPLDMEELNVPLTEEDHRRRRPHPKFKDHNNLEKHVLKLGKTKKSKLKGYVVAAGLQYGKGENLFHCFFKMAWSAQFPKVPVFGPGTNYIPMIHVDDLAGVIHNIIDLKPKSKYIVAVDDSKDTFGDIVKMISNKLGPGQIYTIPEQEAVNMKVLKPEELEYLGINLRLDAFILKDAFVLRWVSEAGMIENMERIVEEYKEIRQLLPIRIYLTGPPAVGKTTVAEKLSRHYQINHIKLKEIIEEKITQLEEMSGAGPKDASEEEAAATEEQLETIRKSMQMNEGRLDDHLLIEIVQEKLNSAPCRNQGFILDGFPKTLEQAKLIFSDVDTENLDPRPKIPTYNPKITPEHVFVLDASDDFLLRRAQALPQSVAGKMRYTEEELFSRLASYRQLSAADETLSDYFDELEIHPVHIEVNVDDPECTDVMEKITEVAGSPKNIVLSPEEQEEENKRLDEERQQRLVMVTAERKRMKEAALAEMTSQYEEWTKTLSEVKNQELELQEAHSLPLRNYLMKYMMPSLSEAMLDCSKLKPDDPVDFLAEHLLQHVNKD